MSLVPYTFPLLNLPIVTLRIVADYWDPFEIYNLSLISKRAKSLAVSLSPKAHQVSLEFHDCFCVQFSGLPGYGFIPSRGENGFELQEFRIGKLYSFSKSPAKEIQKAMRCLTELFKCRSIEFCLLDGSVSELIDWLRLFNEYHVKSGSYEFENEETVRIFFDIYRAPTDLMSFHFSGNATKGLVALPEQTTVDFIRSSVFYDISHLNWHFIKFFDSQNLGILCDKLTKHRIVGLFLESWMSGKCNRQAQTINFLMHEKIRLEEAIKGIPRIESRVVKRYEESLNRMDYRRCPIYWIQEEVDINGPDGRTARVQLRRRGEAAVPAWLYPRPPYWQLENEKPVEERIGLDCDEIFIFLL